MAQIAAEIVAESGVFIAGADALVHGNSLHESGLDGLGGVIVGHIEGPVHAAHGLAGLVHDGGGGLRTRHV